MPASTNAAQETEPGWGWWIKQGATTLWEQWNGTESQNHIMYGDIAAWFTKALAGINPDLAAPGFKHVIVKPNPVPELTHAAASYNSVRGRIASAWKQEANRFELKIEIPANATATVYLPAGEISKVREGGRALEEAEGVKPAGVKDGRVAVEVGSGKYEFTVEK
jgi:alpha-L-rhamnosidase